MPLESFSLNFDDEALGLIEVSAFSETAGESDAVTFFFYFLFFLIGDFLVLQCTVKHQF